MLNGLLHDRGRGPEIQGTRITVYNLIPHFLDPTSTEEQICALYELAPEQVAAARAYVLAHFDEVMAEHRRIEADLNQGNPPLVLEQTRLARARLKSFQEWLSEKEAAGTVTAQKGGPFPSFREWLGARERGQTEGA